VRAVKLRSSWRKARSQIEMQGSKGHHLSSIRPFLWELPFISVEPAEFLTCLNLLFSVAAPAEALMLTEVAFLTKMEAGGSKMLFLTG